MQEKEFEVLALAEVRSIIEDHLGEKPDEFALRFRHLSLPRAVIASQIKNLQKSSQKLPSYYQARCIIPSISYEQASSEAIASLKKYEGKRCLDLTCGLGVDSLHFSKHFEQVLTLEQDAVRARVAVHNFQLLKCDNIEVRHASAETFLANYQGEPFDLVYIDPARRNERKRLFRLADFSPNLLEILPLIRKITSKILIKLSPMFDVAEAVRLFPQLNKIFILSLNNECKELLLELSDEAQSHPPSLHIQLYHPDRSQSYDFLTWQAEAMLPREEAQPQFVLEPDVAFYKARALPHFFKQYYPQPVSLSHPQGFAFSHQRPPSDFPGRVFGIIEAFPYKPKQLKAYFKQQGIERLNVSKRHFPQSTELIRKQLKLKEGGKLFLLCTLDDKGQKWAYLAERKS